MPDPLSWVDPFGLVCAFVDNQGTLNIRNKYPAWSAEDLALQQHENDWNGQLGANGPMTRQAVTPQMRQAADRAANSAKVQNPGAYNGTGWHRGIRRTWAGVVSRPGPSFR